MRGETLEVRPSNISHLPIRINQSAVSFIYLILRLIGLFLSLCLSLSPFFFFFILIYRPSAVWKATLNLERKVESIIGGNLMHARLQAGFPSLHDQSNRKICIRSYAPKNGIIIPTT